MSATFWLVACVVLLLGSGFFSGTEMGLYCVNRLRIRLQAERHPRAQSRALWWLIRHPQDTVMTILVGNNLVNYLLTVSASALALDVLRLSPTGTKVFMVAVLSPLVFVFGDVVPKNLFHLEAERLMNRCSLTLGGCVIVLRYTGMLWMLRQVNRLVTRITGHGTMRDLDTPRAEVLGLLREGGAHGALTAEQAEIIERVMNLSEISVGSIMVPQRKVVTVSIDADRSTVDRIIELCSYSRLPVLSRDHRSIIGIIDIHDILVADPREPLERFIQPVITLPADESATAALVRLQQAEAPMAIVTDSHHGPVGIVTLKDVVEEIFGELLAW
ncbi:MAG TPA: CNNM domain-containing protein [Phycisphaerae bacterium]|nr:CNNM domain-containing protein [Phycisphaerae bacterium]